MAGIEDVRTGIVALGACLALSACASAPDFFERGTVEESFLRADVTADLRSCFATALADLKSPSAAKSNVPACQRLADDPYIHDALMSEIEARMAEVALDLKAACRDRMLLVFDQATEQINETDVWFDKPWVRVRDFYSLQGEEQLLFTLAHTEQAVSGVGASRMEEDGPCAAVADVPGTFVHGYNLAQARTLGWVDRLVARELTDGLEWEVWDIHQKAHLWPGEQLRAAGLHELLLVRSQNIAEFNMPLRELESRYPEGTPHNASDVVNE